jgi:hypothetical protein
MYINGWQRLWLLASVLWAVVILALSGILQSDGDHAVPSAKMVPFVVRLWIVPVAAVYGFGLGLAWVRQGFQVESKWKPSHKLPAAYSDAVQMWSRLGGQGGVILSEASRNVERGAAV